MFLYQGSGVIPPGDGIIISNIIYIGPMGNKIQYNFGLNQVANISILLNIEIIPITHFLVDPEIKFWSFVICEIYCSKKPVKEVRV